MRSALFWATAQRVVVIPFRCFGTTYRPKGPIGCSETSARNCRYSLRNNPEQRSSQLTLPSYMGQLIWVTLLGFLITSEEGCTDRPKVSHPHSSDSLTTFNLHLKIWYRTSVAQPTAEDAEQLTKGRLQPRHVASFATGISIHMKRERRNVFPRRTLAQRFQKMSHKRIRQTYRHLSVFQCLFQSTGSSGFHGTIRICILFSTRFPKVIVLHRVLFRIQPIITYLTYNVVQTQYTLKNQQGTSRYHIVIETKQNSTTNSSVCKPPLHCSLEMTVILEERSPIKAICSRCRCQGHKWL